MAINPITSVLVKKYEGTRATYYEKETKYLNKYDKDAVVIFQSDHGKYFKTKRRIFPVFEKPIFATQRPPWCF